MKKAWYRTWFNSPYYHLLYRERDEAEACKFIDRLLDHLKLSTENKILDAPCGTGRHSKHLYKKGFHVTGVDLSEYSIQKADSDGDPNSEFFVHDIRRPFRINYYDMVLNLFTSLGYSTQSDDIKILRSFKKSMRSGGLLVIDFMNTPLIRSGMIPSEKTEREGVKFLISRKDTPERIIKEVKVIDGGEEQVYSESVLAYSKEELARMIHDSGFTIESIHGNYSLSTFDEAHSPRLIFIARKKA